MNTGFSIYYVGAKNHYISRSVVPSGWYVSGGKKGKKSMSVSSISGASSITQLFSSMFTAKGVSEEKATQVATSVDSVLSSTSVASIVSPRQAIEEKLTSSVQDGTLTEKDASLIRTALNEFESSASGSTAPAGGPPPGGPPPGGAPAGGPPPSGGGSSDADTDGQRRPRQHSPSVLHHRLDHLLLGDGDLRAPPSP